MRILESMRDYTTRKLNHPITNNRETVTIGSKQYVNAVKCLSYDSIQEEIDDFKVYAMQPNNYNKMPLIPWPAHRGVEQYKWDYEA